ncbi:hypothetical protein KAR48_08395 [bacterium]|nr:hypothetical protein [bacterium]
MQINNLSSLLLSQPDASITLPAVSERSGSKPAPDTKRSDSAQFSPFGSILAKTGLNTVGSTIKRESSSFSFNLNFQSSSLLHLNASGLYAEESQTLEMSLSFAFQKEVLVDGQYLMKSFQAEMSLSVSNFESISIAPFSRKENIMDMVQRLVTDIWKTQADPDKELAGIILDKEDFFDLAGIEDGKFLKALAALVQSIYFSARLLEQINGDKDTQKVLLHPQRIKEEGIEITSDKREMIDFNFSITETEAVLSENIVTISDDSVKNKVDVLHHVKKTLDFTD